MLPVGFNLLDLIILTIVMSCPMSNCWSHDSTSIFSVSRTSWKAWVGWFGLMCMAIYVYVLEVAAVRGLDDWLENHCRWCNLLFNCFGQSFRFGLNPIKPLMSWLSDFLFLPSPPPLMSLTKLITEPLQTPAASNRRQLCNLTWLVDWLDWIGCFINFVCLIIDLVVI